MRLLPTVSPCLFLGELNMSPNLYFELEIIQSERSEKFFPIGINQESDLTVCLIERLLVFYALLSFLKDI